MLRPFWLAICLMFVLASCSDKPSDIPVSLTYFPKDAAMFIRINNYGAFRNSLETHPIFQKAAKLQALTPLLDKLESLKTIQPEGQLLVGLYEEGLGQLAYLIVAENKTRFFDLTGVADKAEETLTYQDRAMKKYTIGNQEVFAMLEKELILVSSSRLILEKLVRTGPNTELSEDFLKVYRAADTDKEATLIINPNYTSYLFRNQLNDTVLPKVSGFADWISLDLESRPQSLVFNGVTTPSDSLLQWVDLFEGSAPDLEQVSDYAPNTAEAVLSVHFEDFQVFASNQEALLERKITHRDSLFQTLEELGIMYMGQQHAILLRSYGADQVNEFIEKNTTDTREYKNIRIHFLKKNDWFASSLEPLIKDFDANYCVIFENTCIFTSELAKMNEIIEHFQQGTVFSQAQAYQSAMNSLAAESSFRFVSRSSRMADMLDRTFTTTLARDFRQENFDSYSFAFQLVKDNQGFYHSTSQFAPLTNRSGNSKADVQWSALLEAEAAIPPQFVTNHYSGKQEVVVQDVNNKLYLISNEGDILWKRTLDSKINGPIQQVDLYRNGKLQLAYCTDTRFQIRDRNGKLVTPFDMPFPGGNLNPLAVFDYDNNRNYRFLVTQGTKLHMFDSRGKNVSGFKLSVAAHDILQAPQHIRLNNRDFLCFQLADGTLKITHRTGRDRIQLDEKIDFSDNPIFVYKGKISVTDKNGVMYQVDSNGKLTKTDFNLEDGHRWFASDKTLAIMNDYSLNIKGKKTDLDVGVYAAPQVFELGDKVFVSVTDIQNENTFLFDSQSAAVPGFPISGSSTIDLFDMDKDGQLEAVVKDAGNAVTVYQL